MRQRLRLVIIALLVLLAISATSLIFFYTDLLWFRDVRFASVYLKLLAAKGLTGLVFGVTLFAILLANIYIARRLAPKVVYLSPRADFRSLMQQLRPFVDRWFDPLAVLVSLFVAFSAGVTAGGSSITWLQFSTHATSKVKDPLFGLGLDFYFFVLPAYELLVRFIASALILSIAFALASHFLHGGIVPGRGKETLAPGTRAHLSVLGSLLLIDLAWYWRLAAFNLVYSSRGVVFGASYTDVRAELPALQILSITALAAAAIMLSNIRTRGWRLPAISLAILGTGWILVGNLWPAAVQAYRVSPNEIAKETPYIRLGIKNTLSAYSLDDVKTRQFPGLEALDRTAIDENTATTENIRLWDWRPLKRTYSQIQEIRLYYSFDDVDFDRYIIDGSYRQVALSARELSTDQLPANAQTWINQHLVFTHGYGAVMSPVNEVTPEGLPVLFIKDLPPVSNVNVKIDRPQIYFGENTDDYVIVRTKTAEFDYPRGQKNRYTRYRGNNGVRLDSFWRKAAFAYRFATLKLLLSDSITPESAVLFDRNISKRLEKIAPFLTYDPDPYLVITGGRLQWIIDAFTVSDRYPYSQPFNGRDNYVRNSVKVTVDAYTGETRFYLFDPADPVAATYAKIFPQLFTDAKNMPEDIVRHLRYPESLFRIQADIYSTFHMKDPRVFYNKEDKWDIPTELTENGTEKVAPYYVILKPPGEPDEEFLLMQPLAPANKNNMIAWMAAKSDAPNYGQLLVFDFPKDRLIFGPRQVEARIDQDAEISRQLSLWNQRGSRVIRGNLLVIPVGESLLYVEPIYLEAEETQLPELKRVIVGFGGKVAMGTSFEDALNLLFEGVVRRATPQRQAATETVRSLTAQASRQFKEASDALKVGDFATFGEKIQQLGKTLSRLQELAGD